MSTGHAPQDKMMVLAWLYLLKMAPNTQLNIPNLVSKVTAMQGVTPDNMIDLQIQGFATQLGYGTYSWASLVSTASAAIDGQGVTSNGISVAITSGDYNTLMNYSILTLAKMLNDPT